MAKTPPAKAGPTTSLVEQLAAAEAELADMHAVELADTGEVDHEKRAAIEERLDDLRNEVRSINEADRHAALAEQEALNATRVHAPAEPPEPAAAATEPTPTPTSGQE